MALFNHLNAKQVTAIKEPGRYCDGRGLWLLVKHGKDPVKAGTKSWVFKFRWRGRYREMGLGGVTSVGLAQARELAEAARKLVADGVNPIDHKHAVATARAAEPTFGTLADSMIIERDPWKSSNVRRQWVRTFEVHCAPIRHKMCGAIDVHDVLAVLNPIWRATPEAAEKTMSRMRHVLGAAKVKGYRTGDNPAAWVDNLALLLPPRDNEQRQHHHAMPYDRMPDFMAKLRSEKRGAARALEFTILTVMRTSEVTGARWEEIDLERKVWTVPAARMKRHIEHRVAFRPPKRPSLTHGDGSPAILRTRSR
jgi:hypothetical protein